MSVHYNKLLPEIFFLFHFSQGHELLIGHKTQNLRPGAHSRKGLTCMTPLLNTAVVAGADRVYIEFQNKQ